jgi:hypothetical protein
MLAPMILQVQLAVVESEEKMAPQTQYLEKVENL